MNMKMYLDMFYYVGVQTVRLCHRMERFFTLLFAPLRLLLRRAAAALKKHRGRTLREKLGTFFGYVKKAAELVQTEWKRHPMRGILKVLWLPFAAMQRYWRITKAVATLCLIAISLSVIHTTYQYWQNITYALAVTDEQGDVLGYVEDESDLMAARALAEERLELTGISLSTEVKTAVSLQMVPQASIWTPYELCDEMLSGTDVPRRRACGVYIDDRFQGAVTGEPTARRILNEILEEHRDGQEGVTATFLEKVELVEGSYPEVRMLSVADMKEHLTSEGRDHRFHEVTETESLDTFAERVGVAKEVLRGLNPGLGEGVSVGQTILLDRGSPHLQVLVSGTITYETQVPFAVQRVADASQYEGFERVRTNGENGISEVTATVTYLDGEKISSVITSSRVVRAPVTQVIAYGTKKIDKEYQGGTNSTGRFMWPTPCTQYVSQYFRSGANRHSGLDIWMRDMTGQDIIAADGGKVIVADDPRGTSYWSYGKYIIIDHGGGYQTLYAHCSKLLVKEGDTVMQGQRIALVGNTGRSTSPHLHFEVRVNGKAVNPMRFF